MDDLFETAVLPLFEEHRADWLERARSSAIELAAANEKVTIDDVRDVCPPPEDVDPRVMGAVFRGKHWECVGYQKSRRKSCHNRPVGVFRLKDLATA